MPHKHTPRIRLVIPNVNLPPAVEVATWSIDPIDALGVCHRCHPNVDLEQIHWARSVVRTWRRVPVEWHRLEDAGPVRALVFRFDSSWGVTSIEFWSESSTDNTFCSKPPPCGCCVRLQ